MTGSPLHLETLDVQSNRSPMATLPGNEFLLGQFSVAADVQFRDDVDGALLRVTISFAISFTDQIVLKHDP